MSRQPKQHNPKQKFEEQRKQVATSETFGVKNIQLSNKQKNLGTLIRSNTLVFCEGAAGTGKTLGVLAEYVKQYLVDNTKQLIILRTPVEAGGDKIGFLPDDLSAKIAPHFSSTRKVLETLLSRGKVECDIGKRIHFMVPNYALGETFDNSLVLIDEAQQLQPMILKLLLERLGKNSTCVVAGDRTQLYTTDKHRNGLTDAITRFFRADQKGFLIPRYEQVEHFKFEVEDVQRSDIVKTVIKAYSDM